MIAFEFLRSPWLCLSISFPFSRVGSIGWGCCNLIESNFYLSILSYEGVPSALPSTLFFLDVWWQPLNLSDPRLRHLTCPYLDIQVPNTSWCCEWVLRLIWFWFTALSLQVSYNCKYFSDGKALSIEWIIKLISFWSPLKRKTNKQTKTKRKKFTER